jgi:hypothetical protein
MKRKALALALMLALSFSALSGIVHFETVQAEFTIPKPPVPEFSVRFVNASYSVTTTNPYTGLSETTLQNNNSIEVTFKNQPFDYSNNQIYFNVRARPHFAGNWTEIYPIRNITSSYNGGGIFSYAEYINPDSPTQSNLSYTIITFTVVTSDIYSESGHYVGYDLQRYYSEEDEPGDYFNFLSVIPFGGQVDFQVQALVGHKSQMWVIQHPFYPTIGGYFAPAVAYDKSSDWSNTQTITIGESQKSTPSSETTPTPPNFGPTASPSPEPLLTPEQLGIIVGVAVVVAVMGAGLLLYFKKRNNAKTNKHSETAQSPS